eukprot:29931_1
MKLQKKRQYKQNENDIILEQHHQGYQLSVSNNNDNNDWDIINKSHNTDNTNYNNQNNRPQIHYNNQYSDTQNTQHNNIRSPSYSQHQNPNQYTNPIKSTNNKISLNIGDKIDFNSDPEDSDTEEHNHSGQIMATTKHQVRVRLNNGEINTYFINEIKIVNDNIQHKTEPKMQQHQQELNQNNIIIPEHGWVELYTKDGRKYYQNEFSKETQWERPMIMNSILQQSKSMQIQMENKSQEIPNVSYAQSNPLPIINRPAILSLTETLRNTDIQKPYWWEDDLTTIVIPLDINKNISNEIVVKFYSDLHTGAGDDINDIEIYCIQNLKLWKKYQNYRGNYRYHNMKEHYVWYGTGVTRDVNDICNLGFQNVMTIVFAKTSEYHYNLCKQQKLKLKKNNFQYLFLCRIVCDYESNGNIINASNSDQIYPQFLVRFKRIFEENNKMKLMEELHVENEQKKQEHQQVLNQNNVIVSQMQHQQVLNENNIIVPEHGWTELRNENGRKYYQNEFTKETQWHRPKVMGLQSQFDIPEMKQQSQSVQINNQSQLHLLQQEIPDASFAKSNPLPMNNAKKIEYHKTWICTLCTFAENRIADAMCAMCDTPQPGKIKCSHCTAVNDENTKICVVCNKTISINNDNLNGINAINANIVARRADDNDNQNDINDINDNEGDIMDPEVLKYIEEEFEYHNQLKSKPQPIYPIQPQQNIANMNLIDDPNENIIADMDLTDNSSDNDDIIGDRVDNNNMYNNLIDDPYGNGNPYIDENDFMDVPYMNGNNNNGGLIDDPYGNLQGNEYINIEDIKREQQFLRDLEFARKLQQEENEANGNLGYNFDAFIRQHSRNKLEIKEEENED